MSLIKVVLLILYYSTENKFGFLTQKNPKLANFKPLFQTVRWSNKDLLRYERAIYHSSKVGFEAEAAEIFSTGIYYLQIQQTP